MSQCVPQIRLSTGKVVNIPVFRYHSGLEGESKYGGILKIYYEKYGVRNEINYDYTLTDNEMIELYSSIGNKTCTIEDGSFIANTESYNVFMIYWAEKSDGTFQLCGTGYLAQAAGISNKIQKSNASTIFIKNDVSEINGVHTYITYNEVGITGEDYTQNRRPFELHTFAEMCAYLETLSNPTSSDNALDIYAASDHRQINALYLGSATSMNSKTAGGGTTAGSLFTMNAETVIEHIQAYAASQHLDIELNIYDTDDPYSWDTSNFGGGNGSIGSFDPDGVDPAQIPALPQLSASDIGFMSIYNPGTSQLKSLSAFLWSNAFDIDSFKKLFSDPMQCIIGLGIVPVKPSLGGTKNVTFGDIDSGVGMPYIANEWVEKSMGSVTIDLLYGSFMDYNGTKIQIYLPYIGFRDLSPSDLIGGSISVTYHVNVLDGGCTAYISHSARGVLYQYSGSCIANVPLSSINYSGALQNAISAALSGATVAVGAATGVAPITAMGAMNLVSNASNLALNSKPSVQRSGTVSGSAGLMAIQRPFIVIERPNISVPENMNGFVGNTTNVTMKIEDCHGLTIVDHIHLDSVICTENERNELMKLLKEGVIL